MSYIFISYSSKDVEIVRELMEWLALISPDCTVWSDSELNSRGGQEWWSSILHEIRRCDIFLYSLSASSLKSDPCHREYEYAQQLRKPILPVKIGDFQTISPPVELQKLMFVDVRQRSVEQFRSLQASLRNMPETPPLPDPLPWEPDVPFDKIDLLRDRIERLTADADEQRLLIFDIDDLREDERYRAKVPELLELLLKRGDKLTVQNLERARKLFARTTPPYIKLETSLSSVDLMPKPFAWVDIPPGEITLVENFHEQGYLARGNSISEYVPAFTIAKYPITNAQFHVFEDAEDGYTNDDWWNFTPQAWEWHDQNRQARVAVFGGIADHPRVVVCWYEAIAFCQWLSSRTGEIVTLPTEQQWQRAAQDNSNWAYPWGPSFEPSRCNINTPSTSAVTEFEGKGDSLFNVVDMCGNVWEWCSTDYDTGMASIHEHAEFRIVRGGSWRFGPSDKRLHVDFRYLQNVARQDFNLGFRVCRLT